MYIHAVCITSTSMFLLSSLTELTLYCWSAFIALTFFCKFSLKSIMEVARPWSIVN